MLKSVKIHKKEAGEGRVLSKVPIEYRSKHTPWEGRLKKEAEAVLNAVDPDEGNTNYFHGFLMEAYQREWSNLYSQRVSHLHTIYLLLAEYDENKTYKSKIRKILEGGDEDDE